MKSIFAITILMITTACSLECNRDMQLQRATAYAPAEQQPALEVTEPAKKPVVKAVKPKIAKAKNVKAAPATKAAPAPKTRSAKPQPAKAPSKPAVKPKPQAALEVDKGQMIVLLDIKTDEELQSTQAWENTGNKGK